ncbi:hemerythrin domain-containing protein [Magnetospirillum sp. UT-4]|uniref:hemerythrin domain-containing protein n=1 Tax=Magnetospirillum sp. UT-4 TaxID=2681467 RepID=UPI0013826AFF|nr:hemerythrin domain-containing protein [Magnetospirillum sp. UT-4]CAA7619443.1 Hemerythrin [Magnetospirillum sp. UT-4]
MFTQTRIGALLHQDHMATIDALQELEAFLADHRAPPARGGQADSFLARLSALLRAEVEQHFAFEEGRLFPLFIARGETGIVMMLTHEHRSILPLALKVAETAARAVESGFDDATWREFRDAGAELVEREIFHVQKEEMGLLAAITALVGPEADAELAEAYQREVG